MSFMVVYVKKNLEKELVKQFKDEKLYDVLLREAKDIAGYRQEATAMLAALKKANNIINEVRNDQYM